MGFLLRWLLAFLLIALTFNPTRWNFVRWAGDSYDSRLSMVVLAGLLLVVGYVIYLRATLRSIGAAGMALVLAVFVACIWVLVDIGWLTLHDAALGTWLAILGLSFVMGIGLSWSFVRRSLSGQYDVDDADE